MHDRRSMGISCDDFGVPQICNTKCGIQLAIFFGKNKETPREKVNILL